MKQFKKLIWILLCMASGLCMGAGLLLFMEPRADRGLALMLVMIAIISGFFLRPEKPRRTAR